MIDLNNYKATRMWNITRGFTKKLDLQLENDMLEEEKKEFFDAYQEYIVAPKTEQYIDLRLDIVTDMVDAVCDYLFVSAGLDTKAQLNTVVSPDDQVKVVALKNAVDKNLASMGALLVDIIGNKVDLNHCYSLVVEANNLKPAKSNDAGKGIKGEDWVDPKIKIKEYLASLEVEKYI